MLPPDDAIHRALEALCVRQCEDGSWDTPCEFDPSFTALYLLLRRYLCRGDAALEEEFVRYLRHEQLADGGWGGSPDSDPDLDISVICYFALRAAGVPAGDEALARARRVIGTLGGIAATGFMTRVVLRMLGQVPAAALPYVSPRFMDMPSWFHPNVDDMGMLAIGLVPLGLLHDEQVRPLAPERGVAELGSGLVCWRMRPARKPGAARSSRLESLVAGLVWSGLAAFSGIFRWLDSAFPPVRARKNALRWILDHQGPEPHFLIPTLMHLMALDHGGDAGCAPAVDRILRELESWIVRDGRGAYVRFAPSATHDTARIVEALERFPSARPSMEKAAEWIVSQQAGSPGFWVKDVPRGTRPGGWCFSRQNPWLVDSDDTAIALNGLRVLRHLHPDGYKRGIDWLLAMQDRGGGWAPFTRHPGLIRRLPPGVLEPTLAASLAPDEDITARALIALRPLCNPDDDPAGRIKAAVRRAIAFLWKRRRPDGTWFGHWVVNYAYGTAQVIEALVVCGHGDDPRIAESARWLESVPNPDGGWGESKRSYRTGRFEPGPSNPMVTAFAIRALIAAGGAAKETLRRAVGYLLATQQDDGLWADTGWNGVQVPGSSYIRYDPSAFVLAALAVARDHFQR